MSAASRTLTRRGHPAQVVWSLDLREATSRPAGKGGGLAMVARRSNFALGRRPSVRTALTPPAPCTGTSRLREIFKRAAHQFGLSWKVLSAITEVESAHGCNMGPSSAGAPGSYRRALFAYDHADWYVSLVLKTARRY